MSRPGAKHETQPGGVKTESLYSGGCWQLLYVLVLQEFMSGAQRGYIVQQERGALNAGFWPRKRGSLNATLGRFGAHLDRRTRACGLVRWIRVCICGDALIVSSNTALITCCGFYGHVLKSDTIYANDYHILPRRIVAGGSNICVLWCWFLTIVGSQQSADAINADDPLTQPSVVFIWLSNKGIVSCQKGSEVCTGLKSHREF